MSLVQSPFLRRVLAVDAAATGAVGLLLTLCGAPLADLLGLPLALTRETGLFLVACGLAIAWLASRPALRRSVVWALIAVNGLWVTESLMILALRWVEPTGLGYAFVLAQAAAVAVIADLEYVALRRARAAA
ncbi:MAG: hypothetical protein ABI655_14520 [Phenylobacterium sp.]